MLPLNIDSSDIDSLADDPHVAIKSLQRQSVSISFMNTFCPLTDSLTVSTLILVALDRRFEDARRAKEPSTKTRKTSKL